MTDVQYSSEQPLRVRSRQTSPVPRRQLGSLPANQRSYSRMSSKSGVFGDDSPLMSPLPFYPRRRSVTFAESKLREERPHYNATFSASAPVSPVRDGRRQSPQPASILKVNSSYLDMDEEAASGVVHSQQPAAAAGHNSRRSPVPQYRQQQPSNRGRSASRQRIAARKKEAQLHHSFYDDSFVEEFVLATKSELEREEEVRKLEREARAVEEKERRAEQKAAEADAEVSALQHAKEVLRAAAKRRRASVTPSPTRGNTQTHAAESAAATTRADETSLLKQLEDDSDPDIQAALEQLSRVSAAADARRRSTKRSHAAAAGTRGRHRSLPIVSENVLLDSDDDDDEEHDSSDDGAAQQRRKKARLEKIVSRILSQQKKSKSKRSVVVINWSDSESAPHHVLNDGEEEEEVLSVPARKPPQRTRSRSAVLAAAEAAVLSSALTTKAPARRALSGKRTASVVPDLGDSLLFEEEAEQPILLPRRQRKRPVTTRSISQIDLEADDFLLSEGEAERVMRKAPKVSRPPAPKTKAKRPVPARRAVSEASEVEEEPVAPPAPARRRAAAAAAPRGKPVAPKVSADDPMAVFFDAAFPSPSKFDEMMQQAGGLPESRRGGRGQPNLVLPSSIGRRR